MRFGPREFLHEFRSRFAFGGPADSGSPVTLRTRLAAGVPFSCVQDQWPRDRPWRNPADPNQVYLDISPSKSRSVHDDVARGERAEPAEAGDLEHDPVVVVDELQVVVNRLAAVDAR